MTHTGCDRKRAGIPEKRVEAWDRESSRDVHLKGRRAAGIRNQKDPGS